MVCLILLRKRRSGILLNRVDNVVVGRIQRKDTFERASNPLHGFVSRLSVDKENCDKFELVDNIGLFQLSHTHFVHLPAEIPVRSVLKNWSPFPVSYKIVLTDNCLSKSCPCYLEQKKLKRLITVYTPCELFNKVSGEYGALLKVMKNRRNGTASIIFPFFSDVLR